MNTLQRLRHIGYVNYNFCHHSSNAKSLHGSWFDAVMKIIESQQFRSHSQCCIAAGNSKLHHVKVTSSPLFLQCKALHVNTDKEADTFGTIGCENYETFEMDEDEEKEEELTTNEQSRPHKFKQTRQQYYTMIRGQIAGGNLKSALQTLSTMKENRIYPNVGIYNLLLLGYARQGDLKMCFKLYSDLRKRGLKPKPATYTSLINACAESSNSKEAMKCLYNLRKDMYEKEYPINITHYHTMIKAYSHHGCIVDALQIADEMKDRGISFLPRTYSLLLHCAIGDKENGLRYGLGIWHLMRMENILPNTHVYNSLLMAIRDANVAKLEVNKSLIPGKSNIMIVSNSKEATPDLLATPPVINPLLLSEVQDVFGKELKSSYSNFAYREHSRKSTENTLSEIISQNRLVLFGGAQSILKKMDEDKAKPNTITLTLLVHLSAPSVTAENEIVNYAKQNHIKLDMIFYNVLIKKRVNRNDYENAKAVLNLMQQDDLQADIMTFGTLSVGCKTNAEYREFITGMETMGLMPNKIILSTFICNACRKGDLASLKMLIDYILDNRIKLEKVTFAILDRFTRIATKWPASEQNATHELKFKKFVAAYEKLKNTQKPEIITELDDKTVEHASA